MSEAGLDSLDGDGAISCVGLRQCHLCLAPGADKQYKGIWLHSAACWNAVRSRKRSAKASPQLQQQDDKDMINEPEKWRGNVTPFLSTDSSSRAQARAAVRDQVNVTETMQVDSEMQLDDQHILTRTRYKNYRKKGDDVGSDTAYEDFDEEHEEQKGKYDTTDKHGNKVARVKTEGDAMVRKGKGVTHKRGQRTTTPTDGHDGNADSDRPRRRIRLGADSDAADSAAGGSLQSTFRPRPCSRSFSSGGAAGHARADADEEEPEPKMQPAASPPDKVKKDKVPTPPTASLEFINKKEQLLVDSEKLFDKIAGSRGIATTLAQCRVDISRAGVAFEGELQPDELPDGHEDLEHKIEALKTEVKGLIDKSKSVRRAELEALEGKKDELYGKLSALEVTISEVVSVTTQKKGKAVTQQRKAYMNRRWQITQIVTKLLNGTFSEKHGKFLAGLLVDVVFTASVGDTHLANTDAKGDPVQQAKIFAPKCVCFSVDPSPEEFACSHVVHWTGAVDSPFKAIFDTNKDVISTKLETFESTMAENDKWAGACGTCGDGFVLEGASMYGSTLEDIDMSGSKPWIVSVREGHRRSAPACSPLAGLACVIKPIGDQRIFVHGVAMEPLLQMGIALADFDSFSNTAAGVEFMKAHSFVVGAKPDEMVYLPPACLYYVIAMTANNKKTKTEKEVAHMLHLPVWVKSWHGFSENIKNAIVALNGSTFQQKRGKQMWEERLAWFNKILECDAGAIS
ncbi:unnamed protein product [Prorocentrum cordatum]|uniref:Uncharacterized protein n=1 Tax=Prorocentrum cordatum TaxID=2364126 RepID=A0ABN9XZN8_9DINO|nr:unnamed protein product [Polarella glacialis]